MSPTKKIILVGKPNAGKTLLFNTLSGLNHKVANYAGATVSVSSGMWGEFEVLDFPGTYSLRPISQDEEAAVHQLKSLLKGDLVQSVICVLDATQLERSLIFGLQALELARAENAPIIFALNMYDDLQKNKLSIRYQELEGELGVPVLPISGKTGFGLEDLKRAVQGANLSLRSQAVGSSVLSAQELDAKYGFKSDILLKKVKRLDSLFLSGIWGGVLFFGVMLLLFQSIFTWAAPLMDATESIVLGLGEWISPYLSEGWIRDFFNDAIVGGVGSFIVFVPQIFILTFIIGILEDSGYLSRVAVICHRPLRFFGLSGKSFIPFLSGHACAIPAIYATRTIESPRIRFATLLAVPLISCSARLPIYSLFVVTLFPRNETLFGFLSVQGFVFFLLYIFGYVSALVASALIMKWGGRHKRQEAPFIIELPAYRLPILKPLVRRSLSSAWTFFSEAGPIIFVSALIVWVLGYFPNGGGALETSWLATLGHFIQPLLDPLGVDWKFGVAILTSFMAREVFVSTLGTLNGIDAADENVSSLATMLQNSGMTMASGVALLVFYSIALQCVSTLATIKRETKSSQVPIVLFVVYTGVAYVLAVLTHAIFS